MQSRPSALAAIPGLTLTSKSLAGFILAILAFAALVAGFWDGFLVNLGYWSKEEYSHAYLIPFISAYLIWQNVTELGPLRPQGSWLGAVFALFGAFTILAGELATLFPIIGYGFVFTLWGLAWAWLGWAEFRRVLPALAILIFTVALPSFLFNNLSAFLQLVSSQIGVAIIRLFDISVYIEGNVIDLGSMKLQVVEACSGLRYLFPLMTLAFIMALFFKAPWWKRILLFVSSFPITVLMNSFRIGVIGVLVEYYGVGMAEGFLHDFEGWIVFMAALGVLALEMWLLARIGPKMVTPDSPTNPPQPTAAEVPERRGFSLLPQLVVALVAVLVSTQAASLSSRQENVPERQIFADFPLQLQSWTGKRELLDGLYLDELDLDDYMLANYGAGQGSVNFYVAWYDTQRKGESAHSPRTCLPGGGWRIESFERQTFTDPSGESTPYNRFLINKRGQRQLVYYWFDQRGRELTNEYLVKWYLFWDALTQNRTDGALIRFTTHLDRGDSIAAADQRIQSLMGEIVPLLPPYLAR